MNLSNALSYIQGQVSPNSVTNDCGGEGCKVYRTDLPRQKVVINLEKEFDSSGDNSKRCDRLLFYANSGKNILVAVPIELKGGKGKESQVRAQLKSGLEFAATLVQDLKEPIHYVPIVFTKKGMKETNPKHQRRELKVKINGKTFNVLQGRCGKKDNLATALSQAGYL